MSLVGRYGAGAADGSAVTESAPVVVAGFGPIGVDAGKLADPAPASDRMPYNATTGALYQGKNVARLLTAELEHGYGPGGWAGFGQWLKVGRVVRKGEKGTACMTVVRVGADENGAGGSTKPRGFRVFHYDQTTELEQKG